MINLDDVLTFSEAAEKWGLADGKTIRKAVERNRFEAYEIKKSGNVWLTTYDAMCRVFGEPRNTMIKLYFYDLYTDKNIEEVLNSFYDKAEKALAQGKMVCIAQSEKHPDKILTIIKTKEELEQRKHRMQYINQSWYSQDK